MIVTVADYVAAVAAAEAKAPDIDSVCEALAETATAVVAAGLPVVARKIQIQIMNLRAIESKQKSI